MKKINMVIAAVLLIQANASFSVAQTTSSSTVQELKNHKLELELRDLEFKRYIIETYVPQRGNALLNSTLSQVFDSLAVALVAGGTHSLSPWKGIDTNEKMLRRGIIGAAVGGGATALMIQVVRQDERRLVRELEAMSDEQVVEKYASVLMRINAIQTEISQSK